LQGREHPTELPEAEEWFGAHPTAPSILDDGRPLDDAIASEPVPLLGQRALDRFGPRLPFLLKLLAADQPLSLQAHPNSRQAHSGHQRERRIGIDAAFRNYVDGNHKQELVVALTDFRALCGFRDPLASADGIEALGVPSLEGLVCTLRDERTGLRRAVTDLLGLGRDECREIIDQAVKAAATNPPAEGTASAEVAAVLVELAHHYPDDPGVLVGMLLNRLLLRAGEAVYMPAGNLHAYLRGTAVELMASSDNVLRGGLTPKHVDVPELLRVLDFHGMDVDPMTDRDGSGEPVPGEYVYPLHAADFRLSRIRATAEPLTLPGRGAGSPAGPEVLLCVGGRAVLVCDGRTQVLGPTEAAWVPAADGAVRVRAEDGPALLFRAVVPTDR